MIKECQLQSNQGEDFKTDHSFFECWQRQISFLLHTSYYRPFKAYKNKKKMERENINPKKFLKANLCVSNKDTFKQVITKKHPYNKCII